MVPQRPCLAIVRGKALNKQTATLLDSAVEPSDGLGDPISSHTPPMLYQRQIIAYPGCLRERFESALLDGATPPFSEEEFDWLGKGEHGPERALEWASVTACHEASSRSQGSFTPVTRLTIAASAPRG